MRKFLALLLVAGAATLFVSTSSYAAQDGPNKEQEDGCDHGATGKECRDDPAEKGEDCLEHGKQGGVNEDHCLTPIAPEVTIPTVPEVTVPDVTPTPPATEPEAPRTTAGPTTPVDDEALPITGSTSGVLVGLGTGLALFGAGLRRMTRSSI